MARRLWMVFLCYTHLAAATAGSARHLVTCIYMLRLAHLIIDVHDALFIREVRCEALQLPRVRSSTALAWVGYSHVGSHHASKLTIGDQALKLTIDVWYWIYVLLLL